MVYSPGSFKGTGFHDSGSAYKIAQHLNRVPHSTFVEPFHGVGRVYRATKPVEKEYINDLSCKHLAKSKKTACSTKNPKQCDRIKKAHKTCGLDYKRTIQGKDRTNTLIYMDPPFVNTTFNMYKTKRDISCDELRRVANRFKRATVAVSNKNSPGCRKAFCSDGKYTCHSIPRNFMKHRFTELLAVRKRV